MSKFAERLRQLRTAKGLSQADFAKQIKVSKSSVNMYERGEREPGIKTLESIADYFNVDMDYLLGMSTTKNRNFQDNCSSNPSLIITSNCENLSHNELELIRKFRSLDSRGQAAVLNVLNYEYDSLPGEQAGSSAKEA